MLGQLWTMMMAEAGKVDDLVIEAIVRLKGTIGPCHFIIKFSSGY